MSASFVEPTPNANGATLTILTKNTKYYDLGNGLLKYKEFSAKARE
jgi:hypothetical protein